MFMEICKRGQKLGKSRLSNTKLINLGILLTYLLIYFRLSVREYYV